MIGTVLFYNGKFGFIRQGQNEYFFNRASLTKPIFARQMVTFDLIAKNGKALASNIEPTPRLSEHGKPIALVFVTKFHESIDNDTLTMIASKTQYGLKKLRFFQYSDEDYLIYTDMDFCGLNEEQSCDQIFQIYESIVLYYDAHKSKLSAWKPVYMESLDIDLMFV